MSRVQLRPAWVPDIEKFWRNVRARAALLGFEAEHYETQDARDRFVLSRHDSARAFQTLEALEAYITALEKDKATPRGEA